MTLIWQAFQRTVAERGSASAMSTSDGDLTFDEIDAESARIAEELRRHGIGAGSIVHVVLPNGLAFLPAVLAVWSVDATVGLVSARYRDAELRAVTDRKPPHAYLTTTQHAGVFDRSIEVSDTREIEVAAGQPALSLIVPSAAPPPPSAASEISLVKFTSGSTGAPKGVGLTAANVLAEAQNTISTLAIGANDQLVVPVPASHSYGFDIGLLPLVVAGARVVLRRSFIPREVMADLAHPDTTIFLGVPSMYRILVETAPANVPDLSHVRYLLSCTAPLLPSLVEQCAERLGVAVCQHYGSSETGAIANHRPADVARHPSSVGVALDNVDVRVVDAQGATLPTGEEGEIVVRSGAVAPGYVTDESTAATGAFVALDDGTTEYHTGDLGVIDDDGFIFWRGRLDQVINVGGLKVYPSEVVQVLERCPGVSGARVVAGRDPHGEEIVHAVVTLSQSMREQDIVAYCRQHLADYKVPRRVEIAESISDAEATKMSNLTGDF